jgi:hypothetical protein
MSRTKWFERKRVHATTAKVSCSQAEPGVSSSPEGQRLLQAVRLVEEQQFVPLAEILAVLSPGHAHAENGKLAPAAAEEKLAAAGEGRMLVTIPNYNECF